MYEAKKTKETAKKVKMQMAEQLPELQAESKELREIKHASQSWQWQDEHGHWRNCPEGDQVPVTDVAAISKGVSPLQRELTLLSCVLLCLRCVECC